MEKKKKKKKRVGNTASDKKKTFSERHVLVCIIISKLSCIFDLLSNLTEQKKQCRSYGNLFFFKSFVWQNKTHMFFFLRLYSTKRKRLSCWTRQKEAENTLFLAGQQNLRRQKKVYCSCFLFFLKIGTQQIMCLR